jgi:hypothetical protein
LTTAPICSLRLTFTMPVSPACSVPLSCLNESMLRSSRPSSPSHLLEPLCQSPMLMYRKYKSNENTNRNQSLIPSQASVVDKSRLKLLKRSTEPEIELLLRSVSLATLCKWCEKVLVKPIGPLNYKASFGGPLSTTFWSYYSTMDITILHAAAREIGSRSTAANG